MVSFYFVFLFILLQFVEYIVLFDFIQMHDDLVPYEFVTPCLVYVIIMLSVV